MLGLTLEDLRSEVARFAGFDREWSSLPASAQADITFWIGRGYRQFLYPPVLENERVSHEWSFMKPWAELSVVAPQTTGTVTVVAGVVTLAGATWPEWAADGDLRINGTVYDVASIDSTTQATLVDTSVAHAAGTTYSLERWLYDLPSDFGGFDGDLTYAPEASRSAVRIVPESKIRSLRSTSYRRAGKPEYAAVVPASAVSNQPTSYRAAFWPSPDSNRTLFYRKVLLVPALEDESDIPVGGQQHAETILRSCLAVTEEYLSGTRIGPAMARFMERLRASVAHDRNVMSPDFYGYNGTRDMSSNCDRVAYRRINANYVTVYGQLPT